MSTQTTATPSGFFVQLMPLLADRTLMVIVSKADDQHLIVSVVPKRMKDGESPALSTPLCCTGTAEELDHDLPSHLHEFVAGQVTLSNNLAQIQSEREEAEKAAREELKKKQKTVGNGGAKANTPDAKPKEEEKAITPPAQPPMMSLFDSSAEPEVQPGTRAKTQDALRGSNNNNKQRGRRAMKSTPMRRAFSFNGLKLPDPNPQMSVEDVRGVLSMQYPEIATAAISGPEPVGDTMKYTFERAIGSKG